MKFKMKFKRIFLLAILIFFLALFLHNAWFYSPKSGYDSLLHYKYLETLLFQKRIPLPEETPESYNPPLFYFISGKTIQPFLPLFKGNLLEAIKIWQILIALVLPLVGYLWFDIFRKLNPKSKWLPCFFLIWLMSLPVISKMAPMYSYEIFLLIVSSFVIWFFLKYFLPQPKFSKAIWLGILGGILLLTRIMSALILLSIGLTTILLWWWKKISFKKMLIINLLFTSITFLIGGWFYYFYKDYGVFNANAKPSKYRGIEIFKNQTRNFYTQTFFRAVMSTPIRPNFPNRFIPIFYSDFWGDYWNYFRHRRYPLSEEEAKKFPKKRYAISKERLKMLASQNRVNLLPSFLLLIGFLSSFIKLVGQILKRPKNINYQQFGEGFLIIFFTLTFCGFFYANLKFPDPFEGDIIKPAYILFALPVPFYFGTKALLRIKKEKLVFYFLTIIILISILFNLHFDFY